MIFKQPADGQTGGSVPRQNLGPIAHNPKGAGREGVPGSRMAQCRSPNCP